MPAERNTRGSSVAGSIRSTRSKRRDSFASNDGLPDTGSYFASPNRPMSPSLGFTPYGIPTPGNSRPGSPFNKQNVVKNFRKSNSSNHSFTSIMRPTSPPLSADPVASNSMDVDPSTITWEHASAVVENQKVQSIYEKPVYKDGQLISHGKILTKTVTMTITTTIASTEILHPGEEGYLESMDRYRRQQEELQQKQPAVKQEDVKMESKLFPEAFSPEETTEQERRDIFAMNQNARFHEQLRKANYHSPSPSPPRSPAPTKQE